MRPVYPFSLHLVITLLGIVGILGPQSATFSSDPGTGWHLKSGEIMRGLSAPLFIDPFLALPSGISQRMWICDQWLSDILFSLAYSVSGFEGLNLIVTALFITTFFVFLYQELTLLRPGNPTLYSSVAVSVACLLSFKLAQVHFILRPVVFSFILFIPVWRASRTLAITGTLSKRLSVLLPLLFIIWANLHPSFLLGLLWLSIGFTCGVFTGRIKKLLAPLGIITTCGVCTLINPFGLQLHRSILALTQSDYFMNLHEEWLPPDFTSSEGNFFLITLIFCGTGSVIALLKREFRSQLTLFDLMSFSVALALALRSVRTVPVWGIVSAPLFALSFDVWKNLLFRLVGNAPAVTQGWANIERREIPAKAITQVSLLTACLGILSFFPATIRFRGIDPSIHGAGYPVHLIQNLRIDLESEGKRATLFAHPSFGGTITFYGYPVVNAVIDDRNTLIGEEFYRKFFSAREIRENFEVFVQDLGITHILLSREELNDFPIHQWGHVKVVAEDASHLLYEWK